jgi:heme A synthase
MAVALGSLAALGGWVVLGLSVWQGVAAHAFVGTIATLLLAWAHARCLDRHDGQRRAQPALPCPAGTPPQ